MSRILLAPMQGLADAPLRALLTGLGDYDACVSEFVRVSGTRLPLRSFLRPCPELRQGSRTPSGTPVRVQLMGSDPACLAENAARLAELRPAGIDLNFGCPAPLVNRHRGGAALLDEPELLHAIAGAVRAAVPPPLTFSAKMRLGMADTGRALECAQALAAGGIDELTVHARTRADGYRAPARWAWLARIRDAVSIPVVANGEVWTRADWQAIRALSGCEDVMLGRGAVADPFLVARIRGQRAPQPDAADWVELLPQLQQFWREVRARVAPRHAAGRLKQWLLFLRRTYPAAETLWQRVRAENEPQRITALLDAESHRQAGRDAAAPRPAPLRRAA